MGLAGALELIGGLLIILGFFTRIAAFVLSGMMAVAYFMAHAPQGFLPDPQRRRAGNPLLLCLPLACTPQAQDPTASTLRESSHPLKQKKGRELPALTCQRSRLSQL